VTNETFSTDTTADDTDLPQDPGPVADDGTVVIRARKGYEYDASALAEGVGVITSEGVRVNREDADAILKRDLNGLYIYEDKE
jgi:hypothetical protein